MLFFSNNYKKLLKLLKIEKPLVIFDCETTGLSISSDKIIEIAYIKIWRDGRTKKERILLNPETRIPAETTAVHGIRNRDVKGKPTFRDKAQELWDIFNDCYYGGFNIMSFDLPILRREFVRVGMDFEYKQERIIDSKIIFSYMSPPTLSSAYAHYCHKEFKRKNGALHDAEVAAEVLVKQMERYPEIRDSNFLRRVHQSEIDDYIDATRKFYWLNGETYFAFSKYKDRKLSDIVKKDKKFLEWILEADFSNDTKSIVRLALEGKIIEKPLKKQNRKK